MVNGEPPILPAYIDAGINTRHADTVTAGTIALPDPWIDDIPIDTPVTTTLLLPPHPTIGNGTAADWHLGADGLTNCPVTPTLGCVKLTYFTTSATEANAIAVVGTGKQAGPVVTPSEWLCAEDSYYAFIPSGVPMTLAQMIEQEHADNSQMAWILRIAGLLMAWAAVFMCFSPVTFAADILGDCLNFIPCVGGFMEDLVEGVVNAVVCALSCSIGCSCGLFVIAIMMLVLRPLYGGLLLLAIGCILACTCGLASQAPRKERRQQSDEQVELMEEDMSES